MKNLSQHFQDIRNGKYDGWEKEAMKKRDKYGVLPAAHPPRDVQDGYWPRPNPYDLPHEAYHWPDHVNEIE